MVSLHAGSLLMKRLTFFLLAMLLMPLGAAADGLQTVRVASIPIDPLANVYFADDLGFFKDAGISIEFVPLQNSAAAVAALSGGSVDVAASAITSLAAAHLSGFDVKFIAPAELNTTASRTDVIAVKIDSPIQTAADLNGKTIALSGLKTLQQVGIMSWVDRHGGNSKTLKFVEIPIPQMCAQIESGRVDAALPVEPFITACARSARILGNVYDGIAPRFLMMGYASSGGWLKNNPELASRFASAVERASVWANSHTQESGDILVRIAKLDPTVAKSMARATYATSLDAKMIQPSLDVSAQYDVLQHSFPAAQLIWTHK